MQDGDHDVWKRIVAHRVEQSRSIDSFFLKVLTNETLGAAIPSAAIEERLNELFELCWNEGRSPKDRREAFEKIRSFSTRINEAESSQRKNNNKKRRLEGEQQQQQQNGQRPRSAGTVNTSDRPARVSTYNTVSPPEPTVNITRLALSPGDAKTLCIESSRPFLHLTNDRRAFCSLCLVPIAPSKADITRHCQGRQHTAQLGKKLHPSPHPAPVATTHTSDHNRGGMNHGEAVGRPMEHPRLIRPIEAARVREVYYGRNPTPGSAERGTVVPVHPSFPPNTSGQGPSVNHHHTTYNALPSHPAAAAAAARNPHTMEPIEAQKPSHVPGAIARPASAATSSPQVVSVTITAAPDTIPTKSGALQPRPNSVAVSFRLNMRLPGETIESVRCRLEEWEPFQPVERELFVGLSSAVTNVFPIVNNLKTAGVWTCDDLKAARNVLIDERTEPRSLLLRMVPQQESAATNKKKRADYHLWPKGTLLQLDSRAVEITQRKQQAHNPEEWKRMSFPLDLTRYVMESNKTKLEVAMTAFDSEPFLCQLAVCRNMTAASLFEQILATKSPVNFLSPASSWVKAIQFASTRKTHSLDDDDQPGKTEEEEVGKFIFSLLCPISKKAMVNPVRGSKCLHWQCFDLRNYMDLNFRVHGNRWRCVACENFVSLKSLERCGLTADLLQKFSPSVIEEGRDRVEFRSNGSYELLPERKKRYKGKDNGQASSSSKPSAQVEIIDLD